MNRILRTAAGVGLLCGASLVVSACGGGSALTLEEYLDKVNELDTDTSQRIDEVSAEAADTEDVEKLKNAFDKFPEVFRDFVDGLKNLDPPEDAKVAHDDAVAAGEDFLDAYDLLLEDLQGAETLDDFTTLLDDKDVDDANDRLTAACKDLQEIADDNDITVNLTCGEE